MLYEGVSPKALKALDHFKKRKSGVLVLLRDGATGVPVEPLADQVRRMPIGINNGVRLALAHKFFVILASRRYAIFLHPLTSSKAFPGSG
jgi:hypothetical protein